MKPLKIVHFADAHIDMANYGRHDPDSALPVRVVDFLRALDQIVETAISEKVDFVLFAGDAYKDRNPQPTFQREWGKRMMRLAKAKIPTLLLVGNHDVAPTTGRAHTLQEFDTLQVPFIHVADRVMMWGPNELSRPVQIIAIPWLSRSGLMRQNDMLGKTVDDIYLTIEDRLEKVLDSYIAKADPQLPLILTAHASVEGAHYGSERMVLLGDELKLSGSLVRRKELDYVALGHIHKHQSLNDNHHPPIIYPGSIERIDFGEAHEPKGFVLAEIGKGHSQWQFVRLKTRQYIDCHITPEEATTFMAEVMRQLPPKERVQEAICRVRLSYPADWEKLLDETAIQNHFAEAFSLQIQKHRELSKRARLGDGVAVESLSPKELLTIYWQSAGLDEKELTVLQQLATEVMSQE